MGSINKLIKSAIKDNNIEGDPLKDGGATTAKFVADSVESSEINDGGVAVEDLATIDAGNQTEVSQMATINDMPVVEDAVASTEGDVMDDAALAAQYRSQADTMFKEAKRLREQAEELVPTKKKKSVAESA